MISQTLACRQATLIVNDGSEIRTTFRTACLKWHPDRNDDERRSAIDGLLLLRVMGLHDIRRLPTPLQVARGYELSLAPSPVCRSPRIASVMIPIVSVVKKESDGFSGDCPAYVIIQIDCDQYNGRSTSERWCQNAQPVLLKAHCGDYMAGYGACADQSKASWSAIDNQ